MKCDNCDNEATVREVTRVKGVPIERNLCEGCARELGIAVQPATHIESLLTHFLTHPPGPPPGAPPKQAPPAVSPSAACSSCGLTFADFKQHGVLGCAECYRAFEAPLAPLLERAHEGASRHLGKVPRRQLSGAGRATSAPGSPSGTPAEGGVGGAEDRTQRLNLIRKQLDEAVKAEQYERAAKLRDEMRRLGELGVLPSPDTAPRKSGPRD